METGQFTSEDFDREHKKLHDAYHSKCLFLHRPPVDNILHSFRDDGSLITLVVFDETLQGYDGRVHGGLISAVTDSAMVRCLMGHGVISYTAELNMRFRHPAEIDKETKFVTAILSSGRNKLFKLETNIYQDNKLIITGKSRFFSFEGKE